jgi:multidrug efflux pump subunit AcrA (membrane-fusion protein)
VTLVDNSKLHIDVSLSESDAAKVKLGQPVALTFDALPDVALSGTVATISPAATTSQNVVTYPVQIEFAAGEAPIKVGMSATADIQTEKYANAILVPSRAVTTSGGVSSVTVLQGQQRTPTTIKVVIGAASSGQTVITSCVDTSSMCLKAGDILQMTGSTASTTTNGFSNRNGGLGGFNAPASGPPPAAP